MPDVGGVELDLLNSAFTTSLNSLEAVNVGSAVSAICKASPERGLRPVLAVRCVRLKVPKPEQHTLSLVHLDGIF